MSRKNLTIVEKNDPSVQFTLYDRDARGARTPADLTGATIECYVKADANTADPAPTYVNPATISISAPATAGKCTVQFSSVDVGGTTQQWYHLDVIRLGRRITYAYGDLLKVNV